MINLTPQESKTLGSFIDKDCPDCGRKLIQNKAELIWCSNPYCRYGFEELKLYYWHKKQRT
jgi:ribosomal protein L37AE/L43A